MRPRFVIVNTCDRPERRLIAEWVDSVGYCYMADRKNLKAFDGMTPKDPTPIEAFGFTAYVGKHEAIFEPGGPVTSVYEDGEPRAWQGQDGSFKLPLVEL